MTLLIALQITSVQTELAQIASRKLSSLTGFEIAISQVEIDWFDRVKIKGLNIIDKDTIELLAIDKLEINYKLSSLFKQDIVLDKARLEGLSMSLYKLESDTLNISILINRIKKLFKPKTVTTSPKFSIDFLSLANSSISYASGNRLVKKGLFDANHFDLVNIDAQLQSLVIVEDTFQVNILEFASREDNIGLDVISLKANYLISPRIMRIDSLYAIVGDSKINSDVVLEYSGYADLASFTDSVNIIAKMSEAILSSNDLSYFSPYFNKIDDNYGVSGSFNGTVSNFRVKHLDLHFGNGSNLVGATYFSGLPVITETFLDIRLVESKIFERDIEQYVPSKAFKNYNRFKHINVNGSITGYVEDFVAYGNFSTNLGTIVSDVNLKISPDPAKTSYSGKLKLKEFDLGSYIDEAKVGTISLDGKISGKGINMSNANIDFEGSVNKLELYNYEYSNITISGKFENQYFSGELDIDDPNLKLQTQNVIDFRDGAKEIIIEGELNFAQLDKLNLTKEEALVKTKVRVNIKGFKLDSIRGDVYLENVYAQNMNQELLFEHLTFTSNKKDNLRSVEMISDKANIKIWGNFNFTTAFEDIGNMFHDYFLILKNNADSANNFYESRTDKNDHARYTINVRARFGNIDQFVNLFEPSLRFNSATNLDIQFKHGSSSSLSVQFSNDTLLYRGNMLVGNFLNLDASKIIGKSSILASADFQSEQQYLSNGAKLDNLILSVIWNNKIIDFNWFQTQQKLNNVNDLYGEVHFFEDSTQIHLNRSNLSILEQAWTIHENNYITLKNQDINIRSLNIFSEEQNFSVSGDISKDPTKVLKIAAENLDVAVLNPLVSKQLNGILSGEFEISGIYDSATILSNFFINSFSIDKFLVGNIYSSNNWNSTKKVFDIQFLVRRNNSSVISVAGIFNPFDKLNALDLEATFMQARLDMAQPFIENIFSHIQGSLSGKMNISGPLASPIISGGGIFNNAALKVNYLNTDYKIEGKWAFDSSAIYLDELMLTDANNNSASLGGNFTHHNYRDFHIDLLGEMKRFMVLNTNASNNNLFYGIGVASGTVSFEGPLSDIGIKVKASTDKGTKFYIPIGGTTTTEFEDYISFIDFTDTLNIVDIQAEQIPKYSGLRIEFDLEVTEDAYAEIIFDISSGDIIRGRGTGNLSMTVDTQGEFTMLGSYEFVEGGYNFTMYNIVNKEFSINPKSRITWTGDPYSGIMDIDASYKLSTSLAPLVDTIYQDMPDIKRIYPTEVLLSLDGPLLTPDIDFQIIIDDYPKSNVDLDTQIKGFLNTIATDQQELNRQVFSLLILRKFSPPNAFSSSGTIGSSVSEFVSNQLSYWISQVDENLTIDMDLGDLDENALKTFQLRVSYAFMEGKLIVTRDGGFTDANNEASVGSIAGDWTLEYLLSDDGKLRVKLFNKTNYNQLNSLTGSDSQTLMTGGFSLIYTTSFDRLSDLFNNPNKKNKEKNKNTEPTSSATKPEEDHLESQH